MAANAEKMRIVMTSETSALENPFRLTRKGWKTENPFATIPAKENIISTPVASVFFCLEVNPVFISNERNVIRSLCS